MKKYISLFLSAALSIVFLSACGRQQAPAKKEESPATEIKPPQTAPAQKSQAKEKPVQIEDTETGVPFSQIKVQNWDDGKEKPKVHETAENVLIEHKNVSSTSPEAPVKRDDIPKTATPKDSLAAKITETGKVIYWTPKWRYKGLGGPWLPAANLSRDRSVLAIVETTGEDEGPYGSRIILVNMHDWSIIRIIELNDRNISKICFIPKSTLLACWSDKQLSMKQAASLAILDCHNGKIRSSTTLIKSPLSGLVADLNGQTLAAKPCDSKTLYLFSVEDLSAKPRSIDTSNMGGALAVSPENLFGLAGDKNVELFDASGGRPISSMRLPEGFAATAILFLDDERSILVMTKDGPAFLFKNKVKKQLSELCSGQAFFQPEEKKLYLLNKLKDELLVFKEGLFNEPAEKLLPLEMRPSNNGEILWLDSLEAQDRRFALLGSRGELAVFHKTKARWAKNIIIEPKR